jgi:hypothetical protein
MALLIGIGEIKGFNASLLAPPPLSKLAMNKSEDLTNDPEQDPYAMFEKIESSMVRKQLGLIPPIVFEDEPEVSNGLSWTVFNRLEKQFKRVTAIANEFNDMANQYKAVGRVGRWRKVENDNVPIRWGDRCHYISDK